MKKKLALLFIFTSLIVYSQDFQVEFNDACSSNDTIKQYNILKKWEIKNQNDPELFVAYFNYYFQNSRKEVITTTTTQPNGQSLQLTDKDGKVAGFMGSEIMYINEPFEKGISKINQGIKLFPNRLDMRFGKIYTLGLKKEWKRFTNEIIKTIVYSSKNKNNWTWTNNEKRKDAKQFFLQGLQDYQLTLYNTGNDDLLVNMRQIANKILEFYPKHIESLSNLSITYLLTKQYDKGIEVLLRAEKINPKDGIILSNIAHGYNMKGNKNMAINYYQKMLKLDKQSAEFAQKQIEKLKSE